MRVFLCIVRSTGNNCICVIIDLTTNTIINNTNNYFQLFNKHTRTRVHTHLYTHTHMYKHTLTPTYTPTYKRTRIIHMQIHLYILTHRPSLYALNSRRRMFKFNCTRLSLFLKVAGLQPPWVSVFSQRVTHLSMASERCMKVQSGCFFPTECKSLNCSASALAPINGMELLT